MAIQQQTERSGLGQPSVQRRADWLGDSIISGFIATFGMTVVMAAAYGLARVIGDEEGSRIEGWFWALAHNTLIESTEEAIVLAIGINLLVGLLWAIVYGYDAEPRLARLNAPAWVKGMIFAIPPWLLSIVAFFPIMDGGIFGRDIGAGPLPVIGNLILHLVYGAILGGVYAIELAAWTDGTEAERTNAEQQLRGAAFGTVAGVVVGLAVGWIIGPSLDDVASRSMIALIGALSGGALGLSAGSLAGLERGDRGDSTRAHAR